MAKERSSTKKQGKGQEVSIATSFTCETELLGRIDARAKEQDLNRSQYLRRLARKDLGLEAA